MHRLRKKKNSWGRVGAILLEDFYPQRDERDSSPHNFREWERHCTERNVDLRLSGLFGGKGRYPALPRG